MNTRRWQWRHRLRRRERCDALVSSAPLPGDNRRICWRAFVSGGCREEVSGLSDERVRGRTCCADAGSPGHCTRRLAIISSPGQLSRVFPLHILETSNLWRKKQGTAGRKTVAGILGVSSRVEALCYWGWISYISFNSFVFSFFFSPPTM